MQRPIANPDFDLPEAAVSLRIGGRISKTVGFAEFAADLLKETDNLIGLMWEDNATTGFGGQPLETCADLLLVIDFLGVERSSATFAGSHSAGIEIRVDGNEVEDGRTV